MNRRAFVTGLGAVLAAPLAAGAQQHVSRIGYLGTDPQAPSGDAFRQGLRELGYVEGQNIRIAWRFTGSDLDRLPELAAEFAGLRLDVIVTTGASAVKALERATTATPIVMANYVGDPLADGIVRSLARPGGNITGLIPLAPELSAKRLELLHAALPTVSRVGVMWKLGESGGALQWQETEAAARALGLPLIALHVLHSTDVHEAFGLAVRNRVGGLVILRDDFTFAYRQQIVTLAERNRLPATYPMREFVEAGGLMSYGPNNRLQFRRAAAYVDKILKGAKPGDLPIERPTNYELVLNLKTAKALGLTIPPSLLVRADQVVQ